MKNRSNFSIVIEWDNPRLSETQRAYLMLRELRRQIIDLNLPVEKKPEILFLYDPNEVESRVIERVIEQVKEDGLKGKRKVNITDFWSAKIQIKTASGLRYYEQKNYGVTQTNGELVIFLDSDVIPEANWLKNLLEPFANPDIQIVGGNTYLTLDNLYSKAFALFWFFPLRENVQELRPSQFFFANNLVFRRATAEQFPFPELPIFRGQCRILASQLQKAGVPIYLQTASRVSHPAPNGLNHFINRAFCEGHDDQYLYQLYDGFSSWERTPLGSIKRFVLNLARSLANIFVHYRQTKLKFIEIPAAIGLALIYYILKLIGELIAYTHPELIRNNLSI